MDNAFHLGGVIHIVTANSLMLLEAQKSHLLKSILNEASLVIPESSGVTWALRWFKKLNMPRTPGIDFAIQLIQFASKKKIGTFFLGGSPGVSEKAGHEIKNRFSIFQFSGSSDGYFSSSESTSVITKIKESNARLILVGLGSPRQEQWIYEHRTQLPSGIYMGVGGSFDVWAGHLKRAPSVFQRWGIEWLYRAVQEPWRISRILQLPHFALLAIFESIFHSESE